MVVKKVSLLSGVGLLLGICLHIIRGDLRRNALLLFEVLRVDGHDRSVCLCVCMHVCVCSFCVLCVCVRERERAKERNDHVLLKLTQLCE